jgi:hypothetical protein
LPISVLLLAGGPGYVPQVLLNEPGLRLAHVQLLLDAPDAGYPPGSYVGRERAL